MCLQTATVKLRLRSLYELPYKAICHFICCDEFLNRLMGAVNALKAFLVWLTTFIIKILSGVNISLYYCDFYCRPPLWKSVCFYFKFYLSLNKWLDLLNKHKTDFTCSYLWSFLISAVAIALGWDKRKRKKRKKKTTIYLYNNVILHQVKIWLKCKYSFY